MQIFWIELDNLKYNDFFKEITKFENQKIIFTPNPEILLNIKKDEEFKNLLNKANYLLPDGIWLYIAFQILDNPPFLRGAGGIFINILKLPYYLFNLFFRRKYLYSKYWDRICWSDLTKDLVKYSQNNNIKVTILDLYNPTDLKKVESQKVFSSILKQKFPNLNFDYFVYEFDKKEEIIEKIKKSSSKIVFSTLGMKRQEQSVVEVMSKCENIKIWLWIGSSFDYYIWFQKRAPKLWRAIWLEWLYRLLTWPKKIIRLKRLWNAIFVFIWEVMKKN